MIQKFRKKPVIIEAIQFDGNNGNEIMTFVGKELQTSRPRSGFEHDNEIKNEMIYLLIPTLEGTMKCDRFDYVIKGVKGEFYPCKPDIFEATYEKV